MPLLPGTDGALEHLVAGTGAPVTVFAHGLAGSIAETRPLGSGVEGTRVFFHFRGHGRSAPPAAPWSYAALADDLRGAADAAGATRALGVSMGAGALCALLAETPGRFERAVLFLPTALDQPRGEGELRRVEAMRACARVGDVDRLAALLAAEQPAHLRERRDVAAWVRGQARTLAQTPAGTALGAIPAAAPLADRRALAAVGAPVLVVGQEDDPAHPAGVARELAAALPDATLHVLPSGGALWTHRRQVRELVSGFLNG